MNRRVFAGLLVLSLTCAAATMGAQAKSTKSLSIKAVDINSASEADLVATLGIERAAAKKIVDGRPYSNKRELVSRQLMTSDQYDKLKNMIVAKRMSPTTPAKQPVKAVKPMNPTGK